MSRSPCNTPQRSCRIAGEPRRRKHDAPSASPRDLPPRAGVGFKPEHFEAILAGRPDVGFFEIHAENYMGEGGPPHRRLEAIRARYPLSLHGVGLSIGGPRPLDREHLAPPRRAAPPLSSPALFSEHLAWSSHDAGFLDDLLPLPYTRETLQIVCDHIDETQEAVGPMLLENPSTYVRFAESDIPEAEFLREIVRRTGCGLLLDLNNVEVQAGNHGFDADAYLDAFPLEAVRGDPPRRLRRGARRRRARACASTPTIRPCARQRLGALRAT